MRHGGATIRAARAGTLDPATFRILADDHGVDVAYGAGTARIYGPHDGPDSADRFSARLARLPADLAAAGGRRLADGPPMTARDKAKRTPDAGARRVIARKDLALYAKDDESPSCQRVIGQTLGDSWAMHQTNGHAAVLIPTSTANTAPLRLHTGPDATVRIVCTPSFWRAYSRVRTCRADSSQAVHFTIGVLGVELTAGGFAQGLDYEARETVTDAGGRSASEGEYKITLADKYLWPLRGAACELRQHAPLDPVFVSGLHECAAVIMPMRV